MSCIHNKVWDIITFPFPMVEISICMVSFTFGLGNVAQFQQQHRDCLWGWCSFKRVSYYLWGWCSFKMVSFYYQCVVWPHQSETEKKSPLNPLRAKFFWGNINMYLHFMSFLHIDMTQVLKILPQVRPGPTYST